MDPYPPTPVILNAIAGFFVSISILTVPFLVIHDGDATLAPRETTSYGKTQTAAE